jgi:hypothetical protein
MLQLTTVMHTFISKYYIRILQIINLREENKMKKIIGIFVITLLIATAVLPIQGSNIVRTSQEKEIDGSFKYLFQNDAITPLDIECAGMNRGPDPGYFDLSEFMIGSVALGIIFLESDGSIDPSTEDWTSLEKTVALGALGISGGYQAWINWFISEGLNYHSLNFYTEEHTVSISYEPIIHPSAITDDTWEKLYVAEAMSKLGYTSGDWMQRVRDYNNYIRDTKGTDWAYTVFLVDNSNDADGLFSDGYHAYAYLGGPFTVCPHIIPGGSPPYLREVFAHETGHIFYATDENNGQPEYSGYLNAPDVENSGCLMDNLALCLSSGTKEQVGWKDTDSNQKADILDTFPDTTLTPYNPDPTSDPTPTYNGSGTVVPYPNNNPNGPGNDVTTNFIAFAEYRVDGGMYYTDVFPDDGQWDDPVESFTFTTIPLSKGTHIIEARVTNSVSNSDPTPASDIITVPRSRAINTPFLNFLENHPNLFKLMQLLFQRLGLQ